MYKFLLKFSNYEDPKTTISTVVYKREDGILT